MSATAADPAVADRVDPAEAFACALAEADAAGRDRLIARAKLLAVQQASDDSLNAPTGWLARGVKIGSLIASGIPEAEPLTGSLGLSRRMLLRGQVASFSGHPESLKSTAAIACGLDHILDGGALVFLDWENGEVEFARKVRDLCAGLAPDRDWTSLLDERLFYFYAAGTEPNWDQASLIASEYPNAVWAWDSARGIIRSYGGNEDKAQDVGRFLDPLDEFTKRGHAAASVLIDHVTKASTESTRYSRGSGDKLGAVQVGWYFEADPQPSLYESGRVTLTRKKNRSGSLPRIQSFTVGDGKGALPWKPATTDQSTEGRRETAIIAVLKAADAPMSVWAIREAKQPDGSRLVPGEAKKIKAACERLASDPQRPVRSVGDQFEYVPEADNEPSDPLGF